MAEETAPASKLTEAKLAELTAQIVSAYVTNNSLPAAELPGIIRNVSGSFQRESVPAEVQEATPAVSVRRSITPDYLVCLVCGKHQKTLKRHLASAHGLSPSDYRTRFGLQADYPMVASAYSQARSQMAKDIGLGQKGRGGIPTPPAAPVKSARRGRPPKVAPPATE
ncbi:MAG: MucR family transcriptional regulator [Alphaproteobacteria bacterium]